MKMQECKTNRGLRNLMLNAKNLERGGFKFGVRWQFLQTMNGLFLHVIGPFGCSHKHGDSAWYPISFDLFTHTCLSMNFVMEENCHGHHEIIPEGPRDIIPTGWGYVGDKGYQWWAWEEVRSF